MVRSSDTELRWDDRKKKLALAQPLFLMSIGILIGIYSPVLLLSFSILTLLTMLILPLLHREFEHRSQEASSWKEAQLTDTSCYLSDDKKHIQCKTPTGSRFLVNMTLTNVEAILMGDVSALVRSVDDSIGY